jgi:hypothetical protein
MGAALRVSFNFFANVCEVDPAYYTLFPTAESVFATFGDPNGAPITVYVHPEPFPKSFDGYCVHVRRYFKKYGGCTIVNTNGLSDGYLQSIQQAKTDYLFQLEHDWLFEKHLINHSLDTILEALSAAKANYMRFNKEPNGLTKYQLKIEQFELGTVTVCNSYGRSNNPHIIDANLYREKFAGYIDTSLGGSKGVEELMPVFQGDYIYGPVGYPPTIKHFSGRQQINLFRKSIGNTAYNLLRYTGVLENAFRFWSKRLRARPAAATLNPETDRAPKSYPPA